MDTRGAVILTPVDISRVVPVVIPRLQDIRGYWRKVLDAFFSGNGDVPMYSEEDLRRYTKWDDADETANGYALTAIKVELDVTLELLRQQFSKVGVLISFLGFVLGFGFGFGLTRSVAVGAVDAGLCAAAMLALWAQSPRSKIFHQFKERQDAGVRTGCIKTQWDLFYYYYKWVVRREFTTNAVEKLVHFATRVAICALVGVGVVVLVVGR